MPRRSLAAVLVLALIVTVISTNGLPADEAAPAGFEPLFNGKDLNGWKVYHGKDAAWGVDGGLVYTSGPGGGWLLTDKEYTDFEIRLEFKLPKNGNSGVALRSPLEGDPAYVGMEIQLLDDDGPAYTKIQPYQFTGSIYGVVPPAKHVNKPAGEWNRMHIVAKGRHVSVETNGEQVIDADLDAHKEKEKSHPGLLREKGHLGLQSHDGRVEFRKVFVKPL